MHKEKEKGSVGDIDLYLDWFQLKYANQRGEQPNLEQANVMGGDGDDEACLKPPPTANL